MVNVFRENCSEVTPIEVHGVIDDESGFWTRSLDHSSTMETGPFRLNGKSEVVGDDTWHGLDLRPGWEF